MLHWRHKEAHMPHKEAPEPHQDANMPVKEACGDIGFICASGSGLCLPISLVYWDGFKASSPGFSS